MSVTEPYGASSKPSSGPIQIHHLLFSNTFPVYGARWSLRTNVGTDQVYLGISRSDMSFCPLICGEHVSATVIEPCRQSVQRDYCTRPLTSENFSRLRSERRKSSDIWRSVVGIHYQMKRRIWKVKWRLHTKLHIGMHGYIRLMLCARGGTRRG